MPGSENLPPRRKSYWLTWSLLTVTAAVAGGLWWSQRFHRPLHAADVPAVVAPAELPHLAEGRTDTLIIPAAVVESMRLQSRAAQLASDSRPLRLTGQLMLDPSRLVHVRTRFAGEVVQVGQSGANDQAKPLRAGDSVKKEQLLAVVWSKEIGEKKSDLVDALSKLALHEALYKNLKSLEKSGAVPQRSIDEMHRNCESDLIEVERLRRTLRSWRLAESDLIEIEAEARRIHARAALPPEQIGQLENVDPKQEKTWADVDVHSPIDGVILERNLTVGDIVNTDDDLFKIADLSRLLVVANVYEEDLATLTSLPPEKRHWEVRLTTRHDLPPLQGQIESIGHVIDPNQHTAIVQGWMDNSHGDLRVGQFVEALVRLPYAAEHVEVPATALIDNGEQTFVFVATDDRLVELQRREVKVVQRNAETALIDPGPGATVQAGDRILTRGVIELSAVLNELQPVPTAPVHAP